MKNLISKKLALLAIVLFASIGHAFGAITVSITDDKGVAVDDVVNVGFSSPNCFMETDKNGVLEFLQGEDSGWMNVHLLSSLYQITKIKIDGVDVMSSCDYDSSNGYYYYSIDPLPDDFSVSIEVVKLEPYTISVTLRNGANANVVFFDGAVRHNRYNNEPVTLGKGRNVKMYIDPAAGFQISQVKVEDDNDNGFYITDSYNEPGGYYEFESPNVNYYVTVYFSSVNKKTITVNFDDDEAWVSLRKYKNDPDKGNVYGTTSGEASEFNQGYNFRLNVGLYSDTYQVTSIIDNNEEKISEFRANNYYDFILSEDHTIDMSFGLAPSVTVNFDSNKGYVRLNDEGIGPSTSHYFSTGSTIKIQPYTFSDRYWVSSVTVNDEPITKTDDYYAFTLTENSTVNVLFEENPSVTVYFDEDYGNVVINDNGDDISALVSEPHYFPVGSTVRITPDPHTGYIVSSFAVDGEPVTLTNGYYEFTLTENCYISVVFERPTHTISFVCSHERAADIYVSWFNDYYDVQNYINGNSSMEVSEGRNVQMSLSWINRLYSISKIKVDDNDITEEFLVNGYTFSNITEDHTVYIELETVVPTNNVSVTLSQPDLVEVDFNGYIDGTNYYSYTNQTGVVDVPNGVDVNMDVRLMRSPYQITKILVGENDVTSDCTFSDGYYRYLIPNVSNDFNVTVEFEPVASNTISVSYPDGFYPSIYYEDGFTTTYGSPAELASGRDVKMYIEPNVGSVISSVIISDGTNSQDVTSTFQANGGYYVFTSLSKNYTVEVGFEKVTTHTIKVNFNNSLGWANLNNSWIGSGNENEYNEGSTVRLTADTNSGYMIGSILVGQDDVTNDFKANGYYDIVVNMDYTIDVNFVEAKYYTISVTGDFEHGTYWLANSNPIEGSNVRMEVIPEDGFIATVKEDGNELPLAFIPSCSSGCYTYQFTNIQANHEVEVIFTPVGTSEISFAFNRAQIEYVELNNCWSVNSNSFEEVTTGTVANLLIISRIGYEVESVKVGNTPLTGSLTEDGYYYCEFNVVSDCTVTITMQKKAAPDNVTFTLPALGEGTYCSEFDLDFSNVRGIKAYVASGFNPSTNQLVLTRVDEAPAGTGLLIKGTSGEYSIPTTNSNFLFANMLKGVVKDTYISAGGWDDGWNGNANYTNYFFGSDGQFYRTNGEELSAYSAYLQIPTMYVDSSSLAKIGLIFVDDEEEVGGITTGVGFIWAGEKRTVTTDDAIYNLQGQKVTEKSLKPGIYIKNGKKFMVK